MGLFQRGRNTDDLPKMKIGVKEITVCSKERASGGTEGTWCVWQPGNQWLIQAQSYFKTNQWIKMVVSPQQNQSWQLSGAELRGAEQVWELLRDCARKDWSHHGFALGDWVIFWASGTKHIIFTYEAFPFLNSVTSLAFGGVLVFQGPPFYFSIFEHLSGLLNISRVQVLPLSLVEWISFTCWWNSFLHLS